MQEGLGGVHTARAGAKVMHRCIGVLGKLLLLGMVFLTSCMEMVSDACHSITDKLIKDSFLDIVFLQIIVFLDG